MQIHTNVCTQGNGQIPGVLQEGQKELSLANAVQGSVFSGEIQDIVGNQVRIQVNQYILNALLEGGMNVNIGDRMSFLVKENTGDKIILKPFAEKEQGMNQILLKTLEEAQVPVTERNMEAVKEMMSRGMPVDKKSMVEMGKLLHQFENTSVSTLVSMKSHDIPVTAANIIQYEIYANEDQNHKIAGKVDALFQELLSEAEQATPKEQEKIGELVTKLNEVFSKAEGLESQTVHNTDKIQIRENPQTQTILKTPVADREGLPEQIAGVQPKSLEKEELLHLVKKLGESLKSKIFLTPENLAKSGEESIQDSYETIAKTLDKMIETLQADRKENSKLMDMASDLKNNMNFMSDMNEMAAYVQLPVKINQKEHNGELYVLSRKKQRQNGGSKTAFLHLDLDYLGSTDVRVSLDGTKVTTKFTLNDDFSMKLVEEHLPMLQERLRQLGYLAELSVEETEQKKCPFAQILEADRPSKEIKRFAFDVRA